MATNELKTRIKHAYKTENEWSSSNPVLLQGEVVYSSDKQNKYKVGDGTSTWSQLSYVLPSKSDIGLGNVENKSSATIRGELTKANVTTALGYTPPTTNTTYGVATSSALGLVKSGTDITVDSSGNVSVNDDSHNHVISNVDGLQSALDGKSASNHTHSAYVNQNAFSNVVVGSTTVAADSATDTLTLIAGSNVTLTPDTTNDSVTIAAKDTVYTHPTSAGNKHIPSGGSSGQILRWSADGTAAWGADNNTTYSAGTGLSLSGTTFNHSNSVTAGTAQGDASKTLTFGGTFTIPTVTYDAQGHITGKGTTTMTMPSNPNSDTKVIQTAVTASGYTNWRPLIIGSSNSSTEGFSPSTVTDGVFSVNTISCQPSSGTIKATTFKGTLSGNAATATKWQTARTLTLSGSVTGSVSIDGSGNMTLSTTTNHNHDSAYLKKINPVITGTIAMDSCEANGTNSCAFGNGSIANGNYSFVEGSDSIAEGNYSHAEGRNSQTYSESSHAEGDCSIVYSGIGGHAEGTSYVYGHYNHAENNSGTDAASEYAHAEGYYTSSCGLASHSAGIYTEASHGQYVIGSYNSLGNGPYLDVDSSFNPNGSIFIIGNGEVNFTFESDENMSTDYSVDQPSAFGYTRSNAFRVTGEGKVIGQKAYASSGADYAEYFEWIDSNEDGEDRRGYFVTLEDDKIRIANSGDFILGIVSGNPCIIGNNDECWTGKIMRDEFNCFIYEEKEVQINDPDNPGQTKTVKRKIRKVNPDFDPSQEYVERSQRNEWDCIGLLGKLPVRDDGTCVPNSYCTVSDSGIATASEGRGYRVLRRISNNIVEVLFSVYA